MQGMHSRQGSSAMLQHTMSMNLSEGNCTLGMLPEEDGGGEQNICIAELKRANEVASSVQPTSAADSETDTLLSSDATQESSCRHETMTGDLTAAKPNLNGVHAPASAMLYHTRTASMADSTRLEGSSPIGPMPAQPRSPAPGSVESEADLEMQASTRRAQLFASCSTADESYAGVPDDAQLRVIPSADVEESSSRVSSPLAPFSMVADSMGTPTSGISERSSPADQHPLPHLPESKHSRGLQQLWNSVAHTPLPVPSPCSMAVQHSKLNRRQYEEQGHQRVLVPEMTTPAAGASQSSTVSAVSTVRDSAASELTERATAHSAGSRSMPMEGAESPHR